MERATAALPHLSPVAVSPNSQEPHSIEDAEAPLLGQGYTPVALRRLEILPAHCTCTCYTSPVPRSLARAPARAQDTYTSLHLADYLEFPLKSNCFLFCSPEAGD